MQIELTTTAPMKSMDTVVTYTFAYTVSQSLNISRLFAVVYEHANRT